MSARFLLEESCIMLCELAVDNIGTYPDMEHIAKEQATSHFNF